MNVVTLHDLKDKVPSDHHELERLIHDDQILSATFFACVFSGVIDDIELFKMRGKLKDNVFILFFSFRDTSSTGGVAEGYLSQVDSKLPKTFKTPQAVMSNAHKLELKKYQVDATNWTASHFNIYKKQIEIARGKSKA